MNEILKQFDLKGKVAVITGGGGELCGAMAEALGKMGVSVAILDIEMEKAKVRAESILKAGGTAVAIRCDVLNVGEVKQCYERVNSLWGPPDFLINGAGGNDPRGSTASEFHDRAHLSKSGELSFFDLDPAGFRQVFDLNFFGMFLVTQTFSQGMVAKGRGADQGHRLLRSKSSSFQFYAMAGGPFFSHGCPSQCLGSWFLSDGAT
jgi:NAD(P)-dependent dehydrogenase (short-subunit alcohol dehydrogenase family)